MNNLFLYVYDLSKGMARQYSALFLGKHFDGIWHTGLVIFGQEWFFGNGGIDCCPPKGTILGEPDQIINLGQTNITEDDFYEILKQLSETTYKVGSYNLLEHNCNNFSNDLAELLVGKPIPSHIVDLPKEIMQTPIGPMLKPMLEQAADPIHQLQSGQENALLAKFKSSVNKNNNNENGAGAASTSNNKEDDDPPVPSTSIVYKPNNIDAELTGLLEQLKAELKQNEYNLLVEIKEYLQQQQKELTWSLSNIHVKFLLELYLRILLEKQNNGGDQLLSTILKVFQTISLNKEVAKLILNNDLFFSKFLPTIKQSNQLLELQSNSIQMLSNLCTHKAISKDLLEKHQDELFKEISEFTLINSTNKNDMSVHESSVSFFYNLIAAFHLDNILNESNALTLGCALLERLPKIKSQPKTIYQMLTLLRSCLSVSDNMRELAFSMDFNLNSFKADASTSQAGVQTKSGESSDSYSNVVDNIEHLIKDQHQHP